MNSYHSTQDKAIGYLKGIVRVLFYIVFFVTPYLGFWADRAAYAERGYMAIGGEVFIPAMGQIAMLLLLQVYDNLNRRIHK